MPRSATYLAAALALLPTTVLAHPGMGGSTGLAHGFMHPIGGFDHVLAMVAVGLFAAHLGGRAIWLVPLAFVGMMALGGALGVAGIHIPFVESVIALSIVVLGAVIAMRLDLAPIVAMALVGFFAIFHGHAHGTEMPETIVGLAYGAGFILATALLHAAGIGIGLLNAKADQSSNHMSTKVAGSAMALAGVAVLGGVL